MAKTLVIAEKPSVGRDLAGALPGSFKSSKDKTYLEGDEYVITWAVGHLVGLAPPDDYDPKLKKWRFADLPILPEQFKLVPNDEKSKKQLNAVHRWIRDDDVDQIVNACDAGREGELIFAYVYETAGVAEAGQAPVAQLDDQEGDQGGVRAPARRRGDEDARGRRALALRGRLGRRHERHPRRVDPAALRVRRRRLARPRADADAGAGRPPRGGDPRVQARAVLARRGRLRGLRARASTAAATWAASGCRRTRPRRSSRRSRGGTGTITKLEKKEEREKPQLLYDLTSLQRHANTLFGFSARRTLAAAQRLYEEHKAITYPRTNSRFLPSDQIAEIKPTAELVGHNSEYTARRALRHLARQAAARAAWSTTRRSTTTTR